MRRNGRRPWLVAMAVAVAMIVAGCGGGQQGGAPNDNRDPVAGGTIRMAIEEEAPTLDMGFTTAASARFRSTAVMEGLFAFDASWEPHPMLADSMTTSEDGRTVTVTLRDVTFHNGAKLTPDGVIASLERIIGLGHPLGNVVDSMSTDGNAVVFSLKFPTGWLPTLLADYQAVIFPKSSIDAAGDSAIGFEGMIGTGPYKYVSWEVDKVLTMERFADYRPREEPASGHWGKKVAYADRIEIQPIIDPATRKSSMDSGQVDLTHAVSADLIPQYESAANYHPEYVPMGNAIANINHKSPVMSDLKLRQAIVRGLDWNQIAAGQGPEEVWAINPDLPAAGVGLASTAGTEVWNSADKDAAKRLIEESAYNGEQIVIVSAQTPAPYKAGLVLVEELKKMGLNATFELVDIATLIERRGSDTGWDIIMGADSGYPALIIGRQPARCGNPFGQFCDPRMEEAYDRLYRATTPEEMQAAHDQVQALTYELVPYIKMLEYSEVYLVHNDMVGFEPVAYPPFSNVQAPDSPGQ